MINVNEFGSVCEKCKKWVNPYKGIECLQITLCQECTDPSVDKLRNRIREFMEIKHE